MAHSDDKLDLWLKALDGELTAEERLRLQNDPEFDALDEAAAAYDLASADDLNEAMPAHLADKIIASAELPSAPSAPTPIPVQAKSSSSARLAWFAAAACLIAAVIGWMPKTVTPDPVPTLAELRDQLDTRAAGALHLAMAGTADEAGNGASGELLWDQTSQEGFMTISNLQVNNPDEFQYQLWIFDAQRQPHPVDGGVFDVNTEGEVVVPIHATLPIREPALFAITVEKPGGVVVSNQERIAMVAKVEA